MWEIKPSDNNIVVEKCEFKEKKEDEGFYLPEEQQEKMELNEDGLFNVLKTGDEVEFVEKGEIIVLPNRTIGKFDLPDGSTGKYVNKDRVIAKIFENEED